MAPSVSALTGFDCILSGAPNGNMVQNHLNIALLNYYSS